mmetsp:Transcript_4846/g.11561  ORF Transcript_4846/g.11561 Transcript_4846/m.11561 type:complete len:256 (+) Transcript_4846:551-1318(+)
MQKLHGLSHGKPLVVILLKSLNNDFGRSDVPFGNCQDVSVSRQFEVNRKNSSLLGFYRPLVGIPMSQRINLDGISPGLVVVFVFKDRNLDGGSRSVDQSNGKCRGICRQIHGNVRDSSGLFPIQEFSLAGPETSHICINLDHGKGGDCHHQIAIVGQSGGHAGTIPAAGSVFWSFGQWNVRKGKPGITVLDKGTNRIRIGIREGCQVFSIRGHAHNRAKLVTALQTSQDSLCLVLQNVFDCSSSSDGNSCVSGFG